MKCHINLLPITLLQTFTVTITVQALLSTKALSVFGTIKKLQHLEYFVYVIHLLKPVLKEGIVAISDMKLVEQKYTIN